MTTIPSITDLPTPPQTSDPTNFDTRADAFIAALDDPFVAEVNAFATAANTVAGEVSANASIAEGYATVSINYATKTDAYASGTDNSAKSWAVGGTSTGQPSAGDAKSWATSTSVVAGGLYGAKKYATDAVSSASSTAADAIATAADRVQTGIDAAASAASAAAAASYIGKFRNRLLNGTFLIDQINGGSSTAISDATYCFDGWYALTQTAAVNVSKVSEPEDGYPQAIRLTQNQSSAQRMGLAQIIIAKDCKDLRGGSGTLSGRIRISNSQAVRYAILGWTGTEDAVTKDVVNSWTSSTYTAGNFFLASNVSVLGVGSITPSANTWTDITALTATLGSAFKNIVVMIWTEGTAAQNVTLDIEYLQFEAGTAATPVEVQSYEEMLSRCRYFVRKLGSSDGNDLFGLTINMSATDTYGIFTFDEMFGVPSGTVVGATDFRLQYTLAGLPASTAVVLSSAAKKSIRAIFTIGSSLFTVGQGAVIYGNGGTAGIILRAQP